MIETKKTPGPDAHHCDNCGWTGPEPGVDLCEVRDLGDRLDPGSTVPSGECPDCGCFCYPSAAA